MMMNDKKKMAMLIIGKKSDDNEKSEHENMDNEMDDSDMHKEAMLYCAKGLLKAIEHQNPEKMIEKLKDLMNLISESKDDENEEDESDSEKY